MILNVIPRQPPIYAVLWDGTNKSEAYTLLKSIKHSYVKDTIVVVIDLWNGEIFTVNVGDYIIKYFDGRITYRTPQDFEKEFEII